MKLGDYLVAYLKKIGVSHLFGIPGDLVINLFLKFGRRKGLKIITLSHEPGVGFAADEPAKSSAFAIIEVFIGPRDLSPVTIKYIRASAKKAQIRNQA